MTVKISKFSLGVAAQIFIKISVLFLGLYTNRWLNTHLSAQEYRNYNLVNDSLSTLVMGIILFGITGIIQKFYTNAGDKKTPENEKEKAYLWTTMFVVRIFTLFIGLILVWLFNFFWFKIEDMWTVMGIFLIQFVLMTDLGYRAVCDAVGRSWQFSTTDFLSRLSMVVGLVIAATYFSRYVNLSFYLTLALSTACLALLADGVWQRGLTPFSSFKWKVLKNHLRPMFYLGAASIMIPVFMNTAQPFLKMYGAGDEIINAFSNAYNRTFITALSVPGIVMPTIASMVKKKMDRDEMTFLKKLSPGRGNIILEWTIVVGFLSVVLYAAIRLFGPFILGLIDKDMKYPLAMEILPLISVSALFMPLIWLYSNLIIFLHGEKYELISTAGLTVIALISNNLLIPAFSWQGAAWSTVLIIFSDFLFKTFFLLFQLHKHRTKPRAFSF